jgi:hypothetical protein
VDAPPGRIAQLLVRGVDLGHGPGRGALVGGVTDRDIGVVLAGKASPGHPDGLGARVDRQAEDGEGISRHPTSLPVGDRTRHRMIRRP